MKLVKYVYLGLGVALLFAILWAFDFTSALDLITQIGPLSVLVLLTVVMFIKTLESLTWQLTIPSLHVTDLLSVSRVWMVRMVGEAFNRTIPAGSLGGEPLKAVLLKRRCQVNYREGVASLYTVRTIDLAGQLLFVAGAGVAILYSHSIAASYKVSIGLSVLVLCAMLASLILLPHSQLSRRLKRVLHRRSWGARAIEALSHIEEIEDRIRSFRRRHPRRFYGSLTLSLTHWTLGSVEVYVTFWALGSPIGLGEALLIEAVLQLVRTVTFFIPANLGSQDATYVLFAVELTGVAEPVALGAAIVRRVNELVVLLLGLAIGAMMSVPASTKRPVEITDN